MIAHKQLWKVKGATTVRPLPWLRYTIGAGLLWTIVVFATGYWFGHVPVARLASHIQSLTVQLTTTRYALQRALTDTSRCQYDERATNQVNQLIQEGKYREAAAVADDELRGTTRRLCPGGLPTAWYVASIDALFSIPVTSSLDPTPVLTYQSIERRAAQLGLGDGDIDSPLTIFTFSFNNRLWTLARYSFQEALKRNLTSTADVSMIAKYYAALRSQGYAAAFRATGSDKRAGEVLLRTADAIRQAAGLSWRLEAHDDLVRLLGTHQAAWPKPDTTDPVLKALGGK